MSETTSLRFSRPFLFILLCSSIFGQKIAWARAQQKFCNSESLPQDVQSLIKQEYSAWKIQESTNLSKHAYERWVSEKPQVCPGIAAGHFESPEAISYAVLLVPTVHPDGGYMLLVFSQKQGQSTYGAKVIDKSDQNGSCNYFIHATLISKFFDQPSRKRFGAYTADGFLFVASGEDEYGVEVYFWSSGRYRHEPIDY